MGSARGAAPRPAIPLAVPLLLAWLALLPPAACLGPGGRRYASDPGPYDELEEREREALARARALERTGERERARAVLAGLPAARPTNLAVAVVLQDLELAMLAAGEPLPELEAAPESPLPDRERLRALYHARAEERGDAASLILAARLESDPPAAVRLLERAREADPRCIWAHYGLAHVLYASGEFSAAVAALERALELDPGHLPARRLEVRLLVESGKGDWAVDALEEWLDDARGSPLVEPRAVRRAQLDLAVLYERIGEPRRALSVVEGVLADEPDNSRAHCVRAAAQHARGQLEEALASAERAWSLAPAEPLPAFQRALLIERLRGAEAAARAWRDVLAVLDAAAEAAPDGAASALGSLVIRIQAGTRLQRLERRLGELREGTRGGPEPDAERES